MGIIAQAKRIKELHPDILMLYLSGSFYKTFGKDAYILSALFDYNIKQVEDNIQTCGFPTKAIAKVKSRLEDLKISYMLLDPRNNYDVDEKVDYKNQISYSLTR